MSINLRLSLEQYNELIAKKGNKKKAKYGNKAKQVNGIVFESSREAKRYQELLLLQHGKAISDLKCQVKISCDVNGTHICNYFADFSYWDTIKQLLIFEDSKGCRTPVFMLKKRIVKALTGIEILET